MAGLSQRLRKLREGHILNPPNMRKTREKGATLLLLTLMLLFAVIPMVGLAIDGGMGYLAETRLSAAVDAAALAGARSLSIGLDLSSQTAAAQATVNAYMNANFPNGLYGVSNVAVTSSIQETAFKTRTVSVQATATFPLSFLAIIGKTTGQVAATGQASRRDVNIILTMDRSGSMYGTPCNTMKANAASFADKFTNGRDRLGLITFKASAHLDYASTLNFKTSSPTIDSVIGQIQCAGNTGSAQALWLAYQQILAINEPGALNLIVYFTDGQPNGIAAQFPLKLQTDTRYDPIQTSTLVAGVPPTSCTVKGNPATATLNGVLAQGAPDGATTGYTTGIMDTVGTAISDTSDPLINAPGCAFTQKGVVYVRHDIAFIPTQDLWGNSTVGYKTVDTFPAGDTYAGQMRVDTPTAVVYASTNAADDAGRRIRNDRAFLPIIYSIGLGGDGWVDHDFLKRVANDPTASSYDPTLPAGLYVYAPDAGQLSEAFNRIASEILRLAK